jgi:hypothetical protein
MKQTNETCNFVFVHLLLAITGNKKNSVQSKQMQLTMYKRNKRNKQKTSIELASKQESK